jgi:hypothetical protein
MEYQKKREKNKGIFETLMNENFPNYGQTPDHRSRSSENTKHG